jgi:hypothetical protein
MTFRAAVGTVSGPGIQFCDGLQALEAVDRQRVTCSKPRALRGSVNLERDLRPTRPNDPVWDYGIGVSAGPGNDRVAWVEVHPASSLHVEPVLAKLRWLREWLKSHGRGMSGLPRTFFWVASGAVSIRPGTPQHKRLAQEGLRLVSRLSLDRT